MRIVIAGAGEVGSHLAKMLSDEDRDIIVIDNDEKKLFALDSYNLKTCLGECTSFKTLQNNGVSNCGLFIAVTPYETRNILACSIAKSMGAEKTVARIDNYEFLRPEYSEFFKGMGVDTLIYPELFAAEEIATALKHNWVRTAEPFCLPGIHFGMLLTTRCASLSREGSTERATCTSVM